MNQDSSSSIESDTISQLSEYLFYTCRSIYFRNSWPLYFMLLLYYVLALTVFQLSVRSIYIRRLRAFPVRILSLFCLFLSLMMRACMYCVPFPFRYFTVTFFCQQFPRVILFASLHFLAIFFMNTFLFTSANQLCLGIFRAFLIVLLLLMIVLSVLISISQVNRSDSADFENITAFASFFYYFVLALWLTVFTCRIPHLLRTNPSIPISVRRIMKPILILFAVSAIIWWIRALWTFMVTINVNEWEDSIVNYGQECATEDNGDSWFLSFLVHLNNIFLSFYCLHISSLSPPFLHSTKHALYDQLYYVLLDWLPSALMTVILYITETATNVPNAPTSPDNPIGWDAYGRAKIPSSRSQKKRKTGKQKPRHHHRIHHQTEMPQGEESEYITTTSALSTTESDFVTRYPSLDSLAESSSDPDSDSDLSINAALLKTHQVETNRN